MSYLPILLGNWWFQRNENVSCWSFIFTKNGRENGNWWFEKNVSVPCCLTFLLKSWKLNTWFLRYFITQLTPWNEHSSKTIHPWRLADGGIHGWQSVGKWKQKKILLSAHQRDNQIIELKSILVYIKGIIIKAMNWSQS